MRLYFGGLSRANLRKARQIAPSHTFGTCWTPTDKRLNEIPFFVDNGAFTNSFDPDEWTTLLDSLASYPYRPDFVVLPDAYNDAATTVERHRQHVDAVRERNLPFAHVLQPGLAVETQLALAERLDADFLFLGGRTEWQRSVGEQVVEQGHAPVHVGNPSGVDGLTWCLEIGAASADTTTVTQNDYWHYLEDLESMTRDAV